MDRFPGSFSRPYGADRSCSNGISDADEDSDLDFLSNLGELRIYHSNPTNDTSLATGGSSQSPNPPSMAPPGTVIPNDGAFVFTGQSGESRYAVQLSSATQINGKIRLVLSGAQAGSTYDIYVSDSSSSTVNNRLWFRGMPGQTTFDVPIPSGLGIVSCGLVSDDDQDGLNNGFEILVSITTIGGSAGGKDHVPDREYYYYLNMGTDSDNDMLTETRAYDLLNRLWSIQSVQSVNR